MEDENAKAADEKQPAKGGGHKALLGAASLLSIVLSAGAWILYCISLAPSLAVATAAALCAIFGLRAGKGCLRTIALTALIAALVLWLVFTLFYWAIPYAIEGI